MSAKFWSKVDKTSQAPCWIWLGSYHNNEYPLFTEQKDGKRRYVYAYRVAYELTHGEVQEGRVLKRQCTNSKCVNPDHYALISNLATQDSLTQDQIKTIKEQYLQGVTYKMLCRMYGISERLVRHLTKGLKRSAQAQAHVHARAKSKLTSTDVQEIRRLLKRGMRTGQIAKKFSVSQRTIQSIYTGEVWSSLPER